MYEPVRYRWTRADLPDDNDPTMPSRMSGTPRERVHSWLLTNESENREKSGLKKWRLAKVPNEKTSNNHNMK